MSSLDPRTELELNQELESQGIDLTNNTPPPEHPPKQGPQREQWTGWEEWDQHCRLVQQHTRLRHLSEVIAPIMDHYYDLDEKHLGSIRLPDLNFPKQPDLRKYSYDEVQLYLKDFYQKIFEVAIPQRHNGKHVKRHVRQTNLGQHLLLYQPLQVSKSTSMIRLLEILPAVNESETLSMNLFTVDLDSTDLQYEALSYTWGVRSSSDEKHYVYVNGYRMNITPNLHSALSSLRYPSQSRTLWVDSISINQADVQERCHQVMLMARIYTSASKVLVYLGASTPSTDTLLKMLQSPICDPTTSEKDHDHDQDHNHDHGHDDDEDLIDPAFGKLCRDAGPDLVDGFIDVSSRSWWSRVWILQEYTLNKRDPVFYCGRLKVQNMVFYKNFERLYEWVEHKRRHPAMLDDCSHPACDKSHIPNCRSRSPSTEKPQAKEKNKENETQKQNPKGTDPKAIQSIVPQQRSAGREWTLWGHQVWRAHTVMMRRNHCSPYSMPYYTTTGLNSQYTDLHDAVYGLRELMDPLFRNLFPPDYMIPISTLYTRLAAYMIIVDMNMDIFWYFPYRFRERDWGEMSTPSQDIPSWVPDFTRPRAVRNGECPPGHRRKEPTTWAATAHILDRVLFMDGLLLDEIIEVFPLPANDPFLLLQQLWYVERSHWDPGYLQDKESGNESRPSSEKRKDRFKNMMDQLGGVTAYSSIIWATDDENRSKIDISIVDLIDGLVDFSGLSTQSFIDSMGKIPDVVDMIINEDWRNRLPHDYADKGKEDSDNLTERVEDLSLTDGTSAPCRADRIDEMELRFLDFAKYIIDGPTWKDLIGISTFDYDNFCSQILHRLVLTSAQRVGDILGDRPGREFLKEGLGPQVDTRRCAVSHSPIHYLEHIRAIEDGSHPLEIRLREAYLIDLVTQLHETTADMVGFDRHPLEPEVIQQDEGDMMNASLRPVCTIPLCSSGENKKNLHKVRRSDEEEGIVTLEDLSALKLPHANQDYPDRSPIRWYPPIRKQKHDIHPTLQDVVDFLADRELFITETGLEGITGVGTTGIQDGDDLFLLEGMSYPLIGRLEPRAELGEPKKRRRDMPTIRMKRQILGTAVVRGIDPKEGNLDEATRPSWFEDISEGSRGLFRFG